MIWVDYHLDKSFLSSLVYSWDFEPNLYWNSKDQLSNHMEWLWEHAELDSLPSYTKGAVELYRTLTAEYDIFDANDTRDKWIERQFLDKVDLVVILKSKSTGSIITIPEYNDRIKFNDAD